MLTNWLCQFFLGIYGAWLAHAIYERLCVWWQEGKAEITLEEVAYDDPQLQGVLRHENSTNGHRSKHHR